MIQDVDLPKKASRRVFSEEKRREIVAEYDAAATPAERAAVLRQHGIYTSSVSNWRKHIAASVPRAPRGRRPDPDATETRRLHDQIARLERKLAKSERTVAALGEAHALLQMLAEQDAEPQASSRES